MWVLAVAKMLLVVLAAGIAVQTRTPDEAWLATKNGVVAISTVILIGKLLYDACFTDRFQP